MICKSCGHDYPGTLTRCTRCGASNPNRIRAASQSRLIEFPRQVYSSDSKNQTAVPAWRAELSEKVRAVKARRGAASNSVSNVDRTKAQAEGRSEAAFDNNPIREAALARVRRASESSNRTAPQAQSLPAFDKEATARALDLDVDKAESAARHQVAAKAQSTLTASRASHTELGKASAFSEAKATTQNLPGLQSNLSPQASSVSDFDLAEPIDEIEPGDYLAAEIKRVDQTLGSRQYEIASVSSHIISFLIDVMTIAISSIPFFALIELSNGNFASRSTKLAAVTIILLVTLFYLALTHCLSARTFGMMFTGLCVVDAHTHQVPTLQRALLRVVGCFIAIVPAGMGLLWTIVDRNHRGLQDYISQTLVVRDL
jgi:uncharacterized RDD family membrane protein YckC